VKRRRVVIETSCLSVRPDRLERTGIQEVQVRLLLELPRLRATRPDLELLALPLPEHRQSTPTLTRLIEQASGLSSEALWGHDLLARDRSPTSAEVSSLWASADAVHLQTIHPAQGPLLDALDSRTGRPQVSATIFDVIPLLFPEYFPADIVDQYQAFAAATRRHADFVVGISRHTALDTLAMLSGPDGRPRAAYVTLPADAGGAPWSGARQTALLARLGLVAGSYVVVLGSVEPRKGLERLLDGFERYLRRPDARPLKLVIVGGSGWKDGPIRARMASTPARGSIVHSGYLCDDDLAALVAASATVAMLSMYEGFGLPAAQARAAGVTPLVACGSSLPEAAPGACVQVDPWDPESVAAGLDLVVRVPRRGRSDSSGWTLYAEALIELLSPA